MSSLRDYLPLTKRVWALEARTTDTRSTLDGAHRVVLASSSSIRTMRRFMRFAGRWDVPQGGFTPMHWAAYAGCTTLLAPLLKAGSHINATAGQVSLALCRVHIVHARRAFD